LHGMRESFPRSDSSGSLFCFWSVGDGLEVPRAARLCVESSGLIIVLTTPVSACPVGIQVRSDATASPTHSVRAGGFELREGLDGHSLDVIVVRDRFAVLDVDVEVAMSAGLEGDDGVAVFSFEYVQVATGFLSKLYAPGEGGGVQGLEGGGNSGALEIASGIHL